ncbi:MAG: FAD-dependent oxidoreductase [Planctomycetaceae bacterium]
MKREVLIIGGGVSGVTTGIVLRLLGHPTRIVCHHWLGDSDDATQPHVGERRFASQYPAASIIPHSVSIADEAWHMRTTLRFFEALQFTSTAGVRKQRHYEVYEWPEPIAGYAEGMVGYRSLPLDGSGEPGAPRRAEDVPIYGWSFQSLFAEMPRYRAFLAGLYRNLGGELETGRVLDRLSLENMKSSIVVNCGGAWGMNLSGDRVRSRFVKGILVRADAGSIPWNRTTGEIFSYNYYPDVSIYSRPNGKPSDVYFYPRTDGWLLGGTRLESAYLRSWQNCHNPHEWKGETWSGRSICVPLAGDANGAEIEVPEPVVTLNREIIRRLTGCDLSNFRLTAMEGYRHKRDIVRLEMEDWRGRRVIHNYGHGGAGVTLSWSCAVKIAELLSQTIQNGPKLHEIELRLLEEIRRW